MALTNIFREPRREITETIIGMVPIGGLIYGDYLFGTYFSNPSNGICSNCTGVGGIILGMVVAILVFVFLSMIGIGIAVGTHAIGEAICNTLRCQGIDPRPKQRY